MLNVYFGECSETRLCIPCSETNYRFRTTFSISFELKTFELLLDSMENLFIDI